MDVHEQITVVDGLIAAKWGPEVFGYTLGAKGDDLTFDERDSAAAMPKCLVVDPAFTWARDRKPGLYTMVDVLGLSDT